MATLEKRYTLSPEAICQEVNGEMVVLDLKREEYFSLNEVGTRVWQLLETDTSLQHAHAQLCEEYDVSPDELEGDLLALAGDLEEAGLILAAE